MQKQKQTKQTKQTQICGSRAAIEFKTPETTKLLFFSWELKLQELK